MNEFLGILIGLRIEKKVKQLRICGQRWQKYPKKCLFLNQDAYDDNILFAVCRKRISGIRLADITLVFMNRDVIVIFINRPGTRRCVGREQDL